VVDEAEVDKGREGEAHHNAVCGALHSEPRGGAGVASGPVEEEVVVPVGLEEELGAGECIILPCTLCNTEDGQGQWQWQVYGRRFFHVGCGNGARMLLLVLIFSFLLLWWYTCGVFLDLFLDFPASYYKMVIPVFFLSLCLFILVIFRQWGTT